MARRVRKQDERIESLHARLRAARTTADRLGAYREFAERWGAGDPRPALPELDAALGLPELHRHPLAASRLFLARALMRGGPEVQSIRGALDDLGAARECLLRDTSTDAAECMLAVAHAFERFGEFEIAIDMYEELGANAPQPLRATATARDRAAWETRTALCADAWYRLGDRRLRQTAVAEAMRAHQQSYELRAVLERPDLLAASLAALARVSAAMGDNAAADAYLNRSLQAAAAHERRGAVAPAVAEALEHLAETALAQRRARRAAARAQDARSVFQQLNDASGVARTYVIDGRILEGRGNHHEALQFYAAALRTLDGSGAWRDVPAVLVAMGRVHRLQQQPEQAMFPLREAVAGARAAGDARTEREAWAELATVHEDLGKYRDALDCFRRASTIAATLAREQHQRELIRMRAAFDVDQARGLEQRLMKVQRAAGKHRQEIRVAAARMATHAERARAQLKAVKVARRWLADGEHARAADLLESVVADLEGALAADDHHWHDLLTRVHDVDLDWDERLRRRFPGLTAAEREVCCLELLGRSAREIADARKRDMRTVYKQRQMIRRKTACPRRLTIGEHLKAECTQAIRSDGAQHRQHIAE